jgi:hypothetical protein
VGAAADRGSQRTDREGPIGTQTKQQEEAISAETGSGRRPRSEPGGTERIEDFHSESGGTERIKDFQRTRSNSEEE